MPSSEVEISEMNSLAQSPQRGGSSDQQAAGVPITTASEGRRNEEQQQQIVDVNSSHGAGDRSSDEAKEQKILDDMIKNGIIVLCSLLAAFCLQAILSLPGGITPEQLQSKTKNITDDQLKKLRSFLISDVSCFLLSLASILLLTGKFSSIPYKPDLLYLCSSIMVVLFAAATVLLNDGLVLATNDSLARYAFVEGSRRFCMFLAGLFFLALFTFKEFRSYIKKKCS